MPEVLTPDAESARFIAAMQRYGQSLPAGVVPPAPATPVAEPPATPAMPAVADPPAAMPVDGGAWTETPQTIQQFVISMERNGRSAEDIAAALKAAGHTVPLPAAAEEPKSAAQIEIEKQFGPAPKPDDFKIVWSGRAEGDTAAFAEANTEASNFLAAIGAPVRSGGHMVEEAIDAARRVSRLSPDEQAAYVREQTALAVRLLGGPGEYEKAIAGIAKMLGPVAEGKFWKTLVAMKATSNAQLIVSLHHIAQINAARAKAKAA